MMSADSTLGPRALCCFGLVVSAVGFLIQISAGVDDYPRIPPGPILLIAAAALVWFGARWWWTPAIAVALSAVIIVGAFVTEGTGDRLSEPDRFWPFIGTLIQMVGLVVAVLAGIAALVAGRQDVRRTEHGAER